MAASAISRKKSTGSLSSDDSSTTTTRRRSSVASTLMRRALYPTSSKTCQFDGCSITLGRGGSGGVAQKCSLCSGQFCSNHCAMQPVWHRGYVRLCDRCYRMMKMPGIRRHIPEARSPPKDGPDVAGWRGSMTDEVSAIIKSEESSAPDACYMVAMQAAAGAAAEVGRARLASASAVAAATIDAPSAEIYAAMTLDMLNKFLEYFDNEEQTQAEQLTKWYDQKMNRLKAAIEYKEHGATPEEDSPNVLRGKRRGRAYSASESGRPLSTVLHPSLSPTKGRNSAGAAEDIVDEVDDDVAFDELGDGFALENEDNPMAGFVEELSAKEQLCQNVGLLLDGQMCRAEFDESVDEMIKIHMLQMSTLRTPDHKWTTVRDFEEDDMC